MKRGFTLIEALVGAMLLAAGAVVIMGVAQRCQESAALGAQYERAYRLLDECLDRAATGGVAGLARRERFSGTFETRFPGYEWEVAVETTETTGLFDVTAAVRFERGRNAYEVTAATRIYDPRPVEAETSASATERLDRFWRE